MTLNYYQPTELELKMKPGALSKQGFLGRDECLHEVLHSDKVTLLSFNLSYQQIADGLEALLRKALDQRIYIMKTSPEELRSRDIGIPDLYQPGKNLPFSTDTPPKTSQGYLVGEHHQVFLNIYRGMQECPWQCGNVEWGYFDFLLLNLQTGRQITGPGMIVHLIREHLFFEGFASPYRVDPWAAADVLGLDCPPFVISNKFTFVTDPYSDLYCLDIAQEIQNQFNIPESEAVARINRQFQGQCLVGSSIFYHETPDAWANHIYWKNDSYWWFRGDERAQKGLPRLEAKPVPNPNDFKQPENK